MPIPTPFHARTAALCTALRWKDWAGYYAVCRYTQYVEAEYFAIRHAAGLVDVSPLYKYDVRGPNAAAYLARTMVRDVTRLKPRQVAYTCWCDDAGQIVDDGTVWRIEDDWYRVTASEPALYWLARFTAGYDLTITDVSDQIATLSVQGPNARAVLQQVVAGADLDALGYFRLAPGRVAGFDVLVTRTGYTGDLGFEIWTANAHALPLYDAILEAGRPFGLLPAGLDAQDICRIEAGFILNGVDYYSAPHALIDARKSSPYELDLGWMVALDRAPFNGQAALRREREQQLNPPPPSASWLRIGAGLSSARSRQPAASAKRLVCLALDWPHYTRLFAAHGLPPEVATDAWRSDIPIYDLFNRQVGYATSGAWSPLLKQNLALAHVDPAFADERTEVNFEVTIEHQRRKCRARVIPKPALVLARTRATPARAS